MLLNGYLILKRIFYSLTKKEEAQFNNEMEEAFSTQMFKSIIIGYISYFIVLLTKI